MHDFVAGILESAPYNYTPAILTLGDEAKWPDDTQISQTKLMFPVQQVDYSSAEKAPQCGVPGVHRKPGLAPWISTPGLAKLEKDGDGRITGLIAQNTRGRPLHPDQRVPGRAAGPAAATPATPT